MSEIKLVAALGNPGRQYSKTRHNVAWQMAEYLSFFQELRWQEKFHASYALYERMGDRIHFIEPQTYMNRSGVSVQEVMRFFRITPDQLLVIHDELELGFGMAGFKWGGGLAGHNGLRSIAEMTGTRDFTRFRLGISRPVHPDITGYVLGNFTPEEQAVLPSFFIKAAVLLEEALNADIGEMIKKYPKTRLLE